MNSMKQTIKKAGLILAQTTALITLVATKAFAASISAPAGFGNISLSVNGLINLIIQIVFGIGIAICVIFLVVYGIKYITAGDDVKAIEGARKGITGAIIGLILIILTFAVMKLIAVFFLGGTGDDLFSILPDSYVNP